MKLNRKSNKGFTIIEVLIVLVIASSVLLIVFLAVPQLQRNSRNTQRRSAVASIAGAVNEFNTNNSGALPAAISGTANPLKLCDTALCPRFSEFNLGYYKIADLSVSAFSATVAPLTTDIVKVITGGKCSTATTGEVISGSSRSAVVQYATEISNGFTGACTDV
jgi:prepilin-type N-terminal cleavage/methylation domain-containing protein